MLKKVDESVLLLHNLGNDESDFDMSVFNKALSKLHFYVQLVEETNLKEKLGNKRALMLCRTLLKQCRLKNSGEHHIIDLCE